MGSTCFRIRDDGCFGTELEEIGGEIGKSRNGRSVVAGSYGLFGDVYEGMYVDREEVA